MAEQLGRLAGTVQAKAEDWTDLDALSAQMANVRGAAVDLLARIRASARTPAKIVQTKKKTKKAAPAGAAITKAAATRKTATRKTTSKAKATPAKRTAAAGKGRKPQTRRQDG